MMRTSSIVIILEMLAAVAFVATAGADVKAVVDAEKLKRVILFGDSLGRPTAIEAALILPGRVIGVVGIDTFQRLGSIPPDDAQQRAEAFQADYSCTMKNMVKTLFHEDANLGPRRYQRRALPTEL